MYVQRRGLFPNSEHVLLQRLDLVELAPPEPRAEAHVHEQLEHGAPQERLDHDGAARRRRPISLAARGAEEAGIAARRSAEEAGVAARAGEQRAAVGRRR